MVPQITENQLYNFVPLKSPQNGNHVYELKISWNIRMINIRESSDEALDTIVIHWFVDDFLEVINNWSSILEVFIIIIDIVIGLSITQLMLFPINPDTITEAITTPIDSVIELINQGPIAYSDIENNKENN